MFETLISDVLESVLGQYVDGISRDSISVGVWKGTLELKQLRIRSEAASMLALAVLGKDAPFVVREGIVDTILVDVPWQKLRSTPVKIKLVGLSALVCVNNDDDIAAAMTRAQKVKQSRLAADDAYRAVLAQQEAMLASGKKQSTTWSSWLGIDDLTSSVLQNIQVELRDVTLRIQETTSEFRLDLASARIFSTDSSWEERFLPQTNLPFSYKIVVFEGLSLGFGGTEESSPKSGADYILAPLSFSMKLTIFKGSTGVDNIPSVLLHLDIPRAYTNFSSDHYALALRMSKDVSEFSRKLRTGGGTTGRGLWMEALERLSPGIVQRFKQTALLRPESMKQRLTTMRAYVEARKQFDAAQLSATQRGVRAVRSPANEVLQELEEQLTTEEILLFRDVAASGDSYVTRPQVELAEAANLRVQLHLEGGLFNLRKCADGEAPSTLASLSFKNLWLGVDSLAGSNFDLGCALEHFEMTSPNLSKPVAQRKDLGRHAESSTLEFSGENSWGADISSELKALSARRAANEDEQHKMILLMRVRKSTRELLIAGEVSGLDIITDGGEGCLMSCVQFFSPPKETEELFEGIEKSALANLEYYRHHFYKTFNFQRVAWFFDVTLQAPRFLVSAGDAPIESCPKLVADFGRLDITTVQEDDQRAQHHLHFTKIAAGIEAPDQEKRTILPPTSFSLSVAVEADLGAAEQKIILEGTLPSLHVNLYQLAYGHVLRIARAWTPSGETAETGARSLSSLADLPPHLEARQGWTLAATFGIGEVSVALVDRFEKTAARVVSDGLSASLDRSSGRISGSFMMKKFSCSSARSRDGIVETFLRAGRDGNIAELGSPERTRQDDGYFVRAEVQFQETEQNCGVSLEAQALHISLVPYVIEQLTTFFGPTDPMLQDPATPQTSATGGASTVDAPNGKDSTDALDVPAIDDEPNEAFAEALKRQQASIPFTLTCTFKRVELELSSPSRHARVDVLAKNFSLRGSSNMSGLESEASLDYLHLRDLFAKESSLQDFLLYEYSDKSAQKEYWRLTYDTSARKWKVEAFLCHPRIVYIPAFFEKLQELPEAFMASSAPEQDQEPSHSAPPSSDASTAIEFKVTMVDALMTVPRSPTSNKEGIEFRSESVTVSTAHGPARIGGEVAEVRFEDLSGIVYYLAHLDEPATTSVRFMSVDSPTYLYMSYGDDSSVLQVSTFVPGCVRFTASEANYSVAVLTLMNVLSGTDEESHAQPADSTDRHGTPTLYEADLHTVVIDLCRGTQTAKGDAIGSLVLSKADLSYTERDDGVAVSQLAARKLRLLDERPTAMVAEKSLVDMALDSAEDESSDEANFRLLYEQHQGPVDKIALHARGLQLLLVPPFIAELSEMVQPGSKYLDTSEDPRDVEAKATDLEVHLDKVSYGVCAGRYATDRYAILAENSLHLTAKLNKNRDLTELSTTLSVHSVMASYNVLLRDATVQVVTPFELTAALKGRALAVSVAPVRGSLDVRDMPVISSSLSRLSNLTVTGGSGDGRASSKPSMLDQVDVELAEARILVTQILFGECVPFLDVRTEQCALTCSTGARRIKLDTALRARIFEKAHSRWTPFVEHLPVVINVETEPDECRTVSVTAPELVSVNVSAGLLASLSSIYNGYQRASKIVESKLLEGEDLAAWLQRPAIASFVVKNECGLDIDAALVRDDGHVLWTGSVEHSGKAAAYMDRQDGLDFLLSSSDAKSARSASWKIEASGFVPIRFGFEEEKRAVTAFVPIASRGSHDADERKQVLISWEVSVVNGVPLVYIRSDVVVTNTLAIPIEVKFANADDSSAVRIDPSRSASVHHWSADRSICFRPRSDEVLQFTTYDWSVGVAKGHLLQGPGRGGERSETTLLMSARDGGGKDVYMLMRFHVEAQQCINLSMLPSLVLENQLPRPLLYSFVHEVDGELLSGTAAPNELVRLHSLRVELGGIRLLVTYDNSTRGFRDEVHVIDLGNGLSRSALISSSLQLDPQRKITAYAHVWLQNRSDTSVRVRDEKNQEVVLMPGKGRGDRHETTTVAVGTKRPALRIGTTGSPAWWTPSADVDEMPRAVEIASGQQSLVLHSSPSLQCDKTTEVFVMNSLWIDNRCDQAIEYVGESTMSRRIRNIVEPNKTVPAHLGPRRKKAKIKFRLLGEGEDWDWSYPVQFDAIGELPVLLHQRGFPDVYIARLSVFKTSWGARVLVFKPEDLERPPFVIHNACVTKQIVTFRQKGADASRQCNIRSGEYLRYAWDNPNQVDSPRLMIRITSMDSSDTGLVEIDIRKPQRAYILTRNRKQRFDVLVQQQEATMLVQISDGDASASPEGPSLAVAGSKSSSSAIPVRDWSDLGSDSFDGPDSESGRQAAAAAGQPGGVEKFIESPKSKEPHDVGNTLSLRVTLACVGISVVSQDPVQEIAFVTIMGATLSYVSGVREELTVVQIAGLQVDNQLPNAKWPVAVFFAPKKSAKGREKPSLEFTSDRRPGTPGDVQAFRGIHVGAQPFRIKADEKLALLILKVAEDFEAGRVHGASGQQALEDELAPRMDVVRIQADNFVVNPCEMALSFSTSRALPVKTSLRYRLVYRPALTLFGNIENVGLQFPSIELKGMFDTMDDLARLLRKFYSASFAKQTVRFATNSKLLGNPQTLFNTVAGEVSHAFYEPSEGLSSQEFVDRIGGVTGGVALGVLNSVRGWTGAVSEGVGAWAEDEEFHRERARILNSGDEMVLLSTGIARGANAFGMGVQSGVTGLFYEPWQGAINDGVRGFAEGVGRGIAGAIAKPLVGGLDMVSQPTAGFMNLIMAPNRDAKHAIVPVRPPRAFAEGELVLPFSWRASIGRALLTYTSSDPQSAATLIGWIELTAEAGREDPAHYVELWSAFSSFLYGGFDPLNPSQGRSELHKKRLAVVTSASVVFLTFTGEILWRCALAEIGAVSQIDEETTLLRIRVPLRPQMSAEVRCESLEAKNRLAGMICTADPRLRLITGEVVGASTESDSFDAKLKFLSDNVSFTEDDSETHVVQILVVNDTTRSFRSIQAGLVAGTWLQHPPPRIAPWDGCIFEAITTSDALKGAVCYELEGTMETLAVSFSDLHREDGAHLVRLPAGIDGTVEERKGDRALLTVKLAQRRAQVVTAVDPQLKILIDMGYREGAARTALGSAKGDIHAALDVLNATRD